MYNRSLLAFQKVLQLAPNNAEANYGLGMVYSAYGRKPLAETHWRAAVDARPGYWDALDQLTASLGTAGRHAELAGVLAKALTALSSGAARRTPHQWWKYLALYHSLGETYCTLTWFYEAALTFSNLIALALCDAPVSLDALGISQQVNQTPAQQQPQENPPASELFIPKLIADIARAVKLSEKHIVENTPAAACDSTHRIFGNNNAAHFRRGGEANSGLFIIPLRQALLCKYYMFAPLGKLPAKANTPEWEKYQVEITVNNGIQISSAPRLERQGAESLASSTGTETADTQSKTTAPSTSSTTAVTTLQVQQNNIDVTVSNALLNLAKIFQDGICSGIPARILYINGNVPTSHDILGLYMLSLSLNPSPSTANNIGILLSSLSPDPGTTNNSGTTADQPTTTQSPSKGFYALTMQFYNFGLLLDKRNTHIYTNLGSLLRGQGQTKQAIEMYCKAVECNPTFNIALTNLASALRDQGQIDLSIHYYQKAVECSPDFVEAVSGLANSRSSVCDWKGRGGWGWEKVSVNADGVMVLGKLDGWVPNIISIVDQQIEEARRWGIGVIDSELKAFQQGQPSIIAQISQAIAGRDADLYGTSPQAVAGRAQWMKIWTSWMNEKDEGTKIVQMIEHAMAVAQHRWYADRLKGIEHDASHYPRPKIPSGLPIPLATTILPFHAFTLPFSAPQLSQISQRTSIRITVSSLMHSWLPDHVYPPPPPPEPIAGLTDAERELEENNVGKLVVGYISSDILDHPLAHLMQSVFGFHDARRVHAIIYATTPSDDSAYRRKIERESHEFKDVSSWSSEKILAEIQADGVHILVNLNGFTRGARNDIFAVRPCPVQVSLIGFAGSLGGGWCDYLLGDKYAIGYPDDVGASKWVYKENIIYMPRSFFVCDHRQSALDSLAQRNKQAEGKKKAEEKTRGAAQTPVRESAGADRRPKRFRFFESGAPASKMPRVDNAAIDEGSGRDAISGKCQGDGEPREESHEPEAALASFTETSAPSTPLPSLPSTATEKERSLLLEQILSIPGDLSWEMEDKVRKEVRRVMFPQLPEGAFLMGNLNQLYKIDPTTFMVWLQVLAKLPHAYLWLLQFPKSGEEHLKSAALKWTDNNHAVVDRILFTPIAEKSRHILRARACDVFVDTPECNAHTTAADVVWSGTPIVTYPRYQYKMCSRVAASVVAAALPATAEGRAMTAELLVASDEEYRERLCHFGGTRAGRARLEQIRRTLYAQREVGDFFDTRQWVRHVERGFRQAWRNWVDADKKHIYL